MERLTTGINGCCGKNCVFGYWCTRKDICEQRLLYNRLAVLEDKLESGQLVDTTPYIVEIKGDIPFKYKVIKPTIHRRNVEMCSSMESAEALIKKLQE